MLLVATGGALGAMLRYLTSIIFKQFFTYTFVGTLFVNVIGSFIIGIAIFLIKNKNVPEDFFKYFFIIGLLGSYTTFSAFSIETIELISNNKILLSFIYIILSVSLCLIAAYIGFYFEKITNWRKYK